MTADLVEICARKVHAERKCVLNKQELICRYDCNGKNTKCPEYMPLRNDTEYFERHGDI